MTAAQASLVKESFDQVRPVAGPVTLLFYGRLFDLDPALRPLFHIDIREQSIKLAAMLSVIVDSLDSFDKLRPQLKELGRRHVTYGVQREHYETLTAALLWALGQALESEFSPEIRDAWSEAMKAINSEMLAGSGAAV